MLDSNQESMVFFNLSGKEIGGLALENSINDGNCVNGNNQCDGSINNKCSNKVMWSKIVGVFHKNNS